MQWNAAVPSPIPPGCGTLGISGRSLGGRSFVTRGKEDLDQCHLEWYSHRLSGAGGLRNLLIRRRGGNALCHDLCHRQRAGKLQLPFAARPGPCLPVARHHQCFYVGRSFESSWVCVFVSLCELFSQIRSVHRPNKHVVLHPEAFIGKLPPLPGGL